MVCDKESLHPFKKRKRDKTFDRRMGEETRSDMSSKEISIVCKINIFLYYQRKLRIIGDRLIDPKE